MICLFSLAILTLASGEPAVPRFELHTTGDERPSGTVDQMAADGSVTFKGEAEVPGREIISLRRLNTPLPAWPQNAHLLLNNGDRIAGSPVQLSGAFLHFRPDSFLPDGEQQTATIRFPMTWLSILWLRAPDAVDRDRAALLFEETRNNDRALLRNGDAILGTMIGFDEKKGEFEFETGSGRRIVPASKVDAIAFNNRLNRVRKPTDPYGHLVLLDGTRLTVLSPTIRDGILSARSMLKESLRVPLVNVAAIDFYRSSAVYLSDLKPTPYRYHSYLGEEFGWKADRNLADHPLQLYTPLGTDYYDKGVAVHGECTLTYALDGKYKRFESVVGLDAQLGKRGSAAIRILLDGKLQPSGAMKKLTRQTGPWRVELEVKGVKEMTLLVDPGEGGNVSDYVNWCDARLIP